MNRPVRYHTPQNKIFCKVSYPYWQISAEYHAQSKFLRIVSDPSNKIFSAGTTPLWTIFAGYQTPLNNLLRCIRPICINFCGYHVHVNIHAPVPTSVHVAVLVRDPSLSMSVYCSCQCPCPCPCSCSFFPVFGSKTRLNAIYWSSHNQTSTKPREIVLYLREKQGFGYTDRRMLFVLSRYETYTSSLMLAFSCSQL